MTTAAIYARVSTDEQVAHGTSLESQQEALREYCRRHELAIYDSYVDDGESGATLERPALQRLLTDARQKKFDLVLVYKTDRLSRSIAHITKIILEDFATLKVAFRSITEPYDSSTPAGRMFFVQLGSFADFERGMILERSRLGRHRRAAEGRMVQAKPPFGYLRTKDKGWAFHPDQMKVYKDLVRWTMQGASSRSIAARLHNQGVPSKEGGYWTGATVLDILRKPLYCGDATYGGIKFTIPPLISKPKWQALQDKIKSHRRNTKPVTRYFYMLKGLLYCGRCGCRFYATPKNRKHAANYFCFSKRNEVWRKFCGTPHARQAVFDATAWGTILRLVKDKRFLAEVLDKNKMQDTGQGVIREAELLTVQKAIKARKAEIDKLLELWGNSVFTQDELKARGLKVREALVALEKEEKEIEAAIAHHETAKARVRDIQAMLGRVRNKIDSYTPEKKREFILKIVDRIIVHHTPEKGHFLDIKMKFRLKNAPEFVTSPVDNVLWMTLSGLAVSK